MTTELEQEFFKVFGIEPYISCNTGFIAHYKGRSYVCDAKTCKKCKSNKKVYPEITDRKLLEMICIILNTEGLLTINAEGNIADIKDFVLRFLIGKVNKNNPYCHYKTKNKVKHQIQQLFKEE